MKSIVIAGYVRSPFTFAFKGGLAHTRPDEIAAQVVKGLIDHTGVNPKDIEDLIMGCAFPEGEQGFNIARLVGFLADLPQSMGGVTVNRFCGSSMQAIHMAAGAMQMGAGEAYICAGVESMSRVPLTGFNPLPHPDLAKRMAGAYMGMGETAENVAQKYKISREEQDLFAFTSHIKSAKAQKSRHLNDEIIPLKTSAGLVAQDGCIRADTTLEALAGLKPAFKKNGTVTAATSSPLTDGAAAVLVTTEDYARANKLTPLARIKSFAVSGCDPEIMGIGPVNATQKALKRAGLKVADLDIIELNEAFASQSIASIRDLKLDIKKINLDGGAIALGHPLGATGARITGKAAQILHRNGGKWALATQCIGGGQGIATVLEGIE
ncbi:MAG: acetyl-CoA C-acyltransferase [Rhodospirillaceae bacterium]|nr:MAG: acetyl-CoA C-acyltransferase [Rhodospirillaceae bacterium]